MWQCFRPTISHSKAGVGKAEIIKKNQEKNQGMLVLDEKIRKAETKHCLKRDFPCSLISTNQGILHFETCSSGGKRLFGYKWRH